MDRVRPTEGGALALFLLVFTTCVLLGATERATLDWPHAAHDRRSELPSPDGRHVVYGEPYLPGSREGPELWLKHRERAGRKLLLRLGGTARAMWFLDSRNFLVIDRESSSGMNSCIYDVEGRIVLDIRAALLRYDLRLKPIANGHFYVEAQDLTDSNTVRVAAFGHTDEPPVRCFRFVYTITRTGQIANVSQRISPATTTVCDDQSE